MGISTLHLGLRRGEVLWFVKKIILQPDLTIQTISLNSLYKLIT